MQRKRNSTESWPKSSSWRSERAAPFERFRDRYAGELILYHKGGRKSLDAIAALLAIPAQGLAQVPQDGAAAIEGRKAAWAELQRPRVGRKARLAGTVEDLAPDDEAPE